jgi:signal transduction histidine kinase
MDAESIRIARADGADTKRSSYLVVMRSGRLTQLRSSSSGRCTPRQGDWLAFGAVLALGVPEVVRAVGSGRLAVSLAVFPFATVPLLWRRRFPATVLAVLVAALVASTLVSKAALGSGGVLFGLYAAACYGGGRLRVLSGTVVGAASVIAFGVLLIDDASGFPPHAARATVFGAGAAWLLGLAARAQRSSVAQLQERAAWLERERDEHALRAAERERIRIARELHDVVTHHVTAIAVQAGAAHSTSRSRPERALETLGVIERTARTTLGELRALLGVLRAGETPAPPAPLRPRPSIASLDELVARARASGILVDTEVCGHPATLDPVVDLSAYRVLQEALTNVIKHAPGATASVLVSYQPDQLQIAVSDDGIRPSHADGAGHGLLGMRERVQLAGGRFQAGPATERRGFEVRAWLPINRAGDDRTGANRPDRHTAQRQLAQS